MKNYSLEKWIWSNHDFDKMGWHDCLIYALKFDDKVSFDIDYIFKWNQPEVDGMPFTFWISPVTLVFENVSLFKVNFIMDFVNGLEIDGISKSKIGSSTEWIIETQEGSITIHSDSFQQIVRRRPTLQFNQFIPSDERGSQYFSEIPERDYQEAESITQKRKVEFELYKMAINRFKLKKELEHLNSEKTDTKEFLLSKRELNLKIGQLDKKLNGTYFERY